MKGCEDVQEYEIEFYNRPDGTEPAKDFILNLDKKMQAKVLRRRAFSERAILQGAGRWDF